MAEGVLMPKAGITVEECVITEWLKKPGDTVAVGDILFTYETDKATFECESTAAGTLLEIFYEEGDEVPVLVNVCAVGTPGEDVSALKGAGSASAAKTGTESAGTQSAAKAGAEASGTQSAAEAAAKGSEKDGATAGPDIRISPRAKAVADMMDVDPEKASPTGPYGRVIERDVRRLAQDMPLSPSETAEREEAGGKEDGSRAADSSLPDYTDEKFSAVRKATAKAMTKSLGTMAQLTHHHSFDATAIMSLRKQIKEKGDAEGLPNITLNDMVMFAVTRVILNHPDLNAVIPEENVLRRYHNVHLGMAVDTPRGLMVPTIFNANRMTLSELCIEAKRLAKLCQEGKATPDMLSGASFTVSNVGSLGVEMFTPVVNPPQVGILGVCGITTRVREVDGEIRTYPSMGLSLSYDHRAIDGTPASRFMKELCGALENFPLLMMK